MDLGAASAPFFMAGEWQLYTLNKHGHSALLHEDATISTAPPNSSPPIHPNPNETDPDPLTTTQCTHAHVSSSAHMQRRLPDPRLRIQQLVPFQRIPVRSLQNGSARPILLHRESRAPPRSLGVLLDEAVHVASKFMYACTPIAPTLTYASFLDRRAPIF